VRVLAIANGGFETHPLDLFLSALILFQSSGYSVKKSNHEGTIRPDLEWDQDQEFLDLDGKKIEKRQKYHYRLKLVLSTVSPKCRGAGPIGAGTPSNAQFFGVRY